VTYREFVDQVNAIEEPAHLWVLANVIEGKVPPEEFGEPGVILPSGLLSHWRGSFRELRREIKALFTRRAEDWEYLAAQGGLYPPEVGTDFDVSDERCLANARQWRELAGAVND